MSLTWVDMTETDAQSGWWPLTNGAYPPPPPLAEDEQVPAPSRLRRLVDKVLRKDSGKHRNSGRRSSGPAELEEDDFDGLEAALRRHNDVLGAAIVRTQSLQHVYDPRQIFRLASTDLFVEKTNLVLSRRAVVTWRAGTLATSSAVALILGLATVLIWRTETFSSGTLTTNRLLLAIVQAVLLCAVVLAVVGYLMRLSRMFFREHVTLLARLEALRFGRLYVYTNPDMTRPRDLHDAFEMNLDTSSFGQTEVRSVADSIYARVAEDLGLADREVVRLQVPRRSRATRRSRAEM
jgi:hypothetical protein